MLTPGYLAVPGWFAGANQGAGLAVADVTGNGQPDLVVLAIEHPGDGPNLPQYRIGADLGADGSATWGPWLAIPDWLSAANQGGGVAVADLSGNGTPDLVVLLVDNPEGLNAGKYRIGRQLSADGNVPAGNWTAWFDVPDWPSWENQGAGITVADVTGNGKSDLIVFLVDNPPGLNQGFYRIGKDIDADGVVTGGWTSWQVVPGWFSWENQGGGIAVTDVTGSGTADIVVFGIDAQPDGRNQAFYRVGTDLLPDGSPSGGWSPLLGINNWPSTDNQYSGIASWLSNGSPRLVVLAVDQPGNGAFYTAVDLRPTPAVHGTWEVLPYDSRVLAIHGAVLPSGKVLLFAGSGNNQIRDADSQFRDALMPTSVVWDPTAQAGSNYQTPATIRRADGRPFDFFCGGDTYLADGRVFSAGGNQNYNGGLNLGQNETAVFDPGTGQWTACAPMALGRWYPTLLALGDKRVLAVSGKNGTDGQTNRLWEVYDPDADTWQQVVPEPNGIPGFAVLPYYPHLFLLSDGRLFYSGGHMDDDGDGNQQAGVLDISTGALTFQPVPGNTPAALRNQSSSVLLPPAQTQEVMVIGGGPTMDPNDPMPINDPVDMPPATATTERVVLDTPNPAYRTVTPMSLPRMHMNAVLLPDRTVFASGGAMNHERAGVAPLDRRQGEIYDPETDTWRPTAVASVIRLYHSIALLLPDGSVVTACGNPPPSGQLAPWAAQPNEELRLEIYRPPYMFAPTRPALDAIPDGWAYGTQVTITTAAAPTLRWMHLIRPGVTTHGFDNTQRLVDLPITGTTTNSITLATPTTSTLAPPGWYMLFAVDDNQVPSVATWIYLS